MADYHSILNRAIEGLEVNSEEARRTIYDKARNALMRQLSSLEPALSPAEISKQRLQLEEAIRDTESQFVPSSEQEQTNKETVELEEEIPTPVQSPDPQPIEIEDTSTPSVEESPVIETATLPEEKSEEVTIPAPEVQPPTKEPIAPEIQEPVVKEEIAEINQGKVEKEDIETPSVSAPVPEIKTEEPKTVEAPQSSAPPVQTVPTIEEEKTPSSSQPTLSEKSQKLLDEADASLARVDAIRAEKTNPLEELKETLQNEGINVEETAEKAPEVKISAFEEPVKTQQEPLEEAAVSIDDATLVEKASKKSGSKGLFWIILLLILIGAGTFVWSQREHIKTPLLDTISGLISSIINSQTSDNNRAPETSSPLPSESNDSANDKAQDRLLDTPLEEEPDTSFDENVSLPNIDENPITIPENNPAPAVEAPTQEQSQNTQPAETVAEASENQESVTETTETEQNTQTPNAPQTPTVNIFTASAILYEERRDTGRPDVSTGNVTWELDPTGSAAIGSEDLPSIRGNARIQNRDLRVRFEIMRNLDTSLPASHLIEIEFEPGPLFTDDSINNIAGVLMKEQEQDNGQQIAGAIVKVSENIFWIAMSSQAADQASNTDALKKLKWYDIPVLFASGKRAILTLEKGAAGQKATEGAFTIWEK